MGPTLSNVCSVSEFSVVTYDPKYSQFPSPNRALYMESYKEKSTAFDFSVFDGVDQWSSDSRTGRANARN